MARAYRVLWLPALAVLLPCAVIGLLAYTWLTVDREAVQHRSVTAGQAAAASLGRDLDGHLVAIAGMVSRVLAEDPGGDQPIFTPAPAMPAPVSAAFLYTPAGALVAPDYARAYQRAIDTHLAAAAEPAWQRARVQVEELEARGLTSEALAAAEAWLKQTKSPSLRAAGLLTRARLASSAGLGDVAERDAREIMACCAAERDEYGLSFALYAAWQRTRLAVRDSSGDAKLAVVAREIRVLIDRGDLGAAADETEIELLSKLSGGRGGVAELVHAMAAARARVTRQIDTARAVSAGIADTDAPGPGASKPAIGAIGHGASQALTASVRADNRLVVLVLDTSQLAAWVGAWSTAHASFDIALARGTDARVEGAVLATPLFAESSLFHLVVRARALDPATDRRRQRLFVAAVLAGLALTLLLGYVALRDVSRELRTAAMRSTFVAGVTHELKTPLASIRLLAETLRWGRARPEVAGDLLDTIVEETDRLGRLVDNVLSSSQIESGTRVYHPRMVSMSEAVRDALRRFDYVLKKEGFTVVATLEDDALEVHADPDALGQALLNLLGNAVKYSGLAREIRVRVSREDGGARMSVEDDGIGIPPGEHARVFNSFYRAPDAAAHTAGAGLGLALVRHFAEAHGGQVRVTSQSGRGSTFSVWLPLAGAGNRPYG